MTSTNKFCDAADWFEPDVLDIIHNELRETPRFHRKQWESAMIFRALKQQNKLDRNMLGLSMGGGKELIAYALAPHTRQLVVTDLYEMNTDWDCAKTDDPDSYIKQNKPFPVDDNKLKALRMDMRDLQFADNSFDFCYSTCAIEHIGKRPDFLKHFNEVARVLTNDGIYVFTTEVLFGDKTIRDDHNYVFALSELQDILAESNLDTDEYFDARISHHNVNHPRPSTLRQLAHADSENLSQKVLQEEPHIQLLRGKHPFTCGIFVTRKRHAQSKQTTMKTTSLEVTKQFASQGAQKYKEMLSTSRVNISPFSLLPGEASRFFADHEEFFHKHNEPQDKETIFHTDYFWWGSGKRVFDIAFRIGSLQRIGNPEIEYRIHRFKTLDSQNVECILETTKPAQQIGWMKELLELEMDEEYCYAILAKLRNGECSFDRLEVTSYPLHMAPFQLHNHKQHILAAAQ